MIEDEEKFSKIVEDLRRSVDTHQPTDKDALISIATIASGMLAYSEYTDEEVEMFLEYIRALHRKTVSIMKPIKLVIVENGNKWHRNIDV